MLVIDTILDLIFPNHCIICRKGGALICLPCISAFTKADIPEDNITAVWSYKDPKIKRVIWLLKYKGKRKIADILAENAYGYLIEELSEKAIMENFKDALLVPVPLSSNKQRKRGYNQTELVCKKLEMMDGKKNFTLHKNALQKIFETKNQAEIKRRDERLNNLKGCFLADKKIVAGRNVIIIDDVTTTGATLKEATRALRAGGAKKILKFALAH